MPYEPQPADADAAASDLRVWALEVVAAQPARNGSGIADLLHRICDAAVATLQLGGAAVTIRSGKSAQAVVAASDDAATALAELEFSAGSGPAHVCWDQRRPVLVPDLARSPVAPWPGFTPAALAAGAQAVFALPLQLGTARFGALTLYSPRPRHLRTDETARAVALSSLATELLLNSSAASTDGEIDPNLKSALDVRGEIYQAQGMVMVALGIGLPEALARMRAHAFVTDRTLLEVSVDIIERRLSLEWDKPMHQTGPDAPEEGRP